MCPCEATAPPPKASRIRLKNQTIRLQRPWHPTCRSVPGNRRMAMTDCGAGGPGVSVRGRLDLELQRQAPALVWPLVGKPSGTGFQPVRCHAAVPCPPPSPPWSRPPLCLCVPVWLPPSALQNAPRSRIILSFVCASLSACRLAAKLLFAIIGVGESTCAGPRALLRQKESWAC